MLPCPTSQMTASSACPGWHSCSTRISTGDLFLTLGSTGVLGGVLGAGACVLSNIDDRAIRRFVSAYPLGIGIPHPPAD